MERLKAAKQRFFDRLPENNRLERIWLIAKTDFKKRYYGSFLGLVWALINPLVQLVIYYLVFTIVFKNDYPHFAFFLFLGIIIWMFFAEATNKSIYLIQQNRYLLENIQVNKIDIYLSSLLSVFFAFLFNFIVYYLTSLIFIPTSLSFKIFLFPVLLFNLILFILAMNLILSILAIYLKDINHLWDLTQLLLFWFSGIFFKMDPTVTWRSALLTHLSPIYGIIANSRAVLIYNEPIDWGMFLFGFVYTFILLGIAYFTFSRYSKKVLEQL